MSKSIIGGNLLDKVMKNNRKILKLIINQL